MERTSLVILAFFGSLFTTSVVQAQRLDYEWLNQPCQQFISCITGCSACNLPINASQNFIGTNVVWSGISTCPHPVSDGDNSVYTGGWPIDADPLTWVGVSAIALEPMQIDSVIIRHRRSPDGPQRLRVSYTGSAAQPTVVVGEMDITQQYQETVITDLGCLDVPENGGFATMQIRLQAYQGGPEGDWQLDAMRIVASPCSAVQVGIEENFQRPLNGTSSYVDVLGRPVSGQPAPGVYLGTKKRVQVF